MELIKTTGMVLSSAPIGENDRRVVLLTLENGKFSAFARNARRPKSALLAASMPFSFGDFYYYTSRTSNTIVRADIQDFFPKLHEQLEESCYGLYFAELSEYYTREFNDERNMLKLLYQTLRALSSPRLNNRLIRCIFEWRVLVINGEYPDIAGEDISHTLRYALDFATKTPIEKLYTFSLSEEVLTEMEGFVRAALAGKLDRPMKSLHMLGTVLEQ